MQIDIIVYIIYLLVTILNLVKERKIYQGLGIGLIFLLIIGSNGGVDYLSTEKIYNESNFNDLKLEKFLKGDIFLYFFTYLAKKIGLTFYEFNFILTSILILVFIRKAKNVFKLEKLNRVVGLYLLYLIFESVIQKRNFVALIFLLLGIMERIKKKYLKGFILVIISYWWHSSFIIYVLMYLVSFLDRKKILRLSKILFIFNFILIINKPILLEVLQLFDIKKAITYVNKQNFLNIVVIILFFGIHFYFIQLIKKYERKYKDNDFIIKLNYLSMILIPFYMYDIVFFRIYRNLLILNLIIMTKNNYIYRRIVIIFIILIMLYYVRDFNNLILGIFIYNKILN